MDPDLRIRTPADSPDARHETTDQKVGGSSPSERATYTQVRAIFSGARGGPAGCRGPDLGQPAQLEHACELIPVGLGWSGVPSWSTYLSPSAYQWRSARPAPGAIALASAASSSRRAAAVSASTDRGSRGRLPRRVAHQRPSSDLQMRQPGWSACSAVRCARRRAQARRTPRTRVRAVPRSGQPAALPSCSSRPPAARAVNRVRVSVSGAGVHCEWWRGDRAPPGHGSPVTIPRRLARPWATSPPLSGGS